MNRYAALTVLYNPDSDYIKNIESYINEVEKVYVLDNSTQPNNNEEEISQIKKCKYVKLDNSQGLAYALNIGCNNALEDGFDYIITMDQDSCFEEGAVRKLIDFIESSTSHYAIVAPNVRSIYNDAKTGENKIAFQTIDVKTNKECSWVMTSGSLMCLEDYKAVNGFDNNLFIDHIDIDMGIRLFLHKKKIIMIGDAIIYQRFGNSIPKKLFGRTICPYFGSPIRQYYRSRNTVYLYNKYGKKITKKFLHHPSKGIIKVLLFEDKKIKKVKMYLKGRIEGKKGITGKYLE